MVWSGAGAEAGACAAAGGAAGAAVAAAVQFFAAAQCLLPDPYPPHRFPASRSQFEFVVVGGGTAGAALAARLAAAAPVLLLEAGPDPPPDSAIPAFKSAMVGGAYDWQLTAEAEGGASQALRGGRQAQPRGRMLGGCGSLNDMVYARGFPDDYRGWAADLAPDPDASRWDWPHVLEIFKRTEHLTDERIVDDPELMKLHGRGGAVEVAGRNESGFDTEVFLRAFQELGFELVRDMTSPTRIGVGRPSHTIRGGARDSTLTALLNKAPQDRLFVMKEAEVTRVLIANGTAYGVRVLHGGQELEYYASKEVVLTAGTFHTPKLLMLSGVGPREQLAGWGIPAVADLPVGGALHDHVMVLSYLSAAPGTCPPAGAAAHLHTARYLVDRSGPLAEVDSVTAYMALPASAAPHLPDFAFYPSCMPAGTHFYSQCTTFLRFNENICTQLQGILKDRELISVAAVLLRPESRGRVELAGADPGAPPRIYSGTFSAAEDLAGYPDAIDVVRRLAETDYFKSKNAEYVELEIAECAGSEGAERARCVARATAMSAWHAAGTAGMGRVLDARLRVRGVRGLRVADASAMPRVVRGNTNAPVHMIAEQAADFLAEEYQLEPPTAASTDPPAAPPTTAPVALPTAPPTEEASSTTTTPAPAPAA